MDSSFRWNDGEIVARYRSARNLRARIPAFAGMTPWKPLSHRERGWGEGQRGATGELRFQYSAARLLPTAANHSSGMDSSVRSNDGEVVGLYGGARNLRAWIPAFAGMTAWKPLSHRRLKGVQS